MGLPDRAWPWSFMRQIVPASPAFIDGFAIPANMVGVITDMSVAWPSGDTDFDFTRNSDSVSIWKIAGPGPNAWNWLGWSGHEPIYGPDHLVCTMNANAAFLIASGYLMADTYGILL